MGNWSPEEKTRCLDLPRGPVGERGCQERQLSIRCLPKSNKSSTLRRSGRRNIDMTVHRESMRGERKEERECEGKWKINLH